MADPNTPTVLSKLWGQNRCFMYSHTFEAHHASIKKGGFSSRHRHLAKFNQFYLVSGRLLVHRFAEGGDDEPFDTVLLESGKHWTAVPREWHRFEAEEDCELIELYWNDSIDPQDIERRDQGGIKGQEGQ
jgi:mannose-6-phosphate isomerase-like protein (cupin superfamily)